MATKSTKKPVDWVRMTQFVIFCISCVAGMMIWYYANQEQTINDIEIKYVTKTELQLIEHKIDSIESSLKDLKSNFSGKLLKMEETNRDIVGLITDIRIQLARTLD